MNSPSPLWGGVGVGGAVALRVAAQMKLESGTDEVGTLADLIMASSGGVKATLKPA